MNKRLIAASIARVAISALGNFATGALSTKILCSMTGADSKAKTIKEAYRNVPLGTAIAGNAVIVPLILFGFAASEKLSKIVAEKIDPPVYPEKEIEHIDWGATVRKHAATAAGEFERSRHPV